MQANLPLTVPHRFVLQSICGLHAAGSFHEPALAGGDSALTNNPTINNRCFGDSFNRHGRKPGKRVTLPARIQ